MNVTEIGIKEGRTPCYGEGCRQRDSAEHEGYNGTPTETRITENNITNAGRIEKGVPFSFLPEGIEFFSYSSYYQNFYHILYRCTFMEHDPVVYSNLNSIHNITHWEMQEI
jgi:hypothetical protein